MTSYILDCHKQKINPMTSYSKRFLDNYYSSPPGLSNSPKNYEDFSQNYYPDYTPNRIDWYPYAVPIQVYYDKWNLNYNFNYPTLGANPSNNKSPFYNMYKDYINFSLQNKTYNSETNNISSSVQSSTEASIGNQITQVRDSGFPVRGSALNFNEQESLNQDFRVNWKEKRVKRCGVVFIIKSPDNIIENFKILVVKGVSGIWSLPKGRCLPNELDEDCAMRELYEETGIKLDNLKNNKRFKIGTNVYYKYECLENEFTEFTIHDTIEVEEVGWKTIQELRQLICNKDIRSILNYKNRIYTYHTNLFN